MRGGARLQDDDEARPPIPLVKGVRNGLGRRLQGILLLLGSMLIVPFMDAAAKYLETAYKHPLLQVVWLRSVLQLAVTMPVAIFKHGFRATLVDIPRRPLLFGRGCLLLGATISFFGAIEFVPLADSVAITFIEPCFLLVLSRLFLHERVPCDRWVASVIGFAAVLLIVKPGASTFQPASCMPLLCALFFSLYLVATRFLLRQPNPPPPLILLAYQSLPGAFALAGVQPLVWTPLASPLELMLGLSMGVIGACSHGLLILAFDAAEASVLSPLLYTEIIMQVVLGFACFGDLPDALSGLGIAMIVAVGVYIARQQEPSGSGDAGSGSVIGSSGSSSSEHSGNRSGCQGGSAGSGSEGTGKPAAHKEIECAAADCAAVTQATKVVAEAREEPVPVAPVVHGQVTLDVSPPRS